MPHIASALSVIALLFQKFCEKANFQNSSMEVHLVSYANTYADVDDHVGFGVDPPVIAIFFRLLSLGFGRIFTINPCICPILGRQTDYWNLFVNNPAS